MRFTPELLYEQTHLSRDAKALVKVGYEVLYGGRPDLARQLFESAFEFLWHEKFGVLKAKTIAGVVVACNGIGKPELGQTFLKKLNLSPGSSEEQKVIRSLERAERVKLPKVLKADTQVSHAKRHAFSSTLLKRSTK